jgi:hypothetical protein
MSGRLGRYAPIQLMDYALERGAVTLVLGAVVGWAMAMPVAAALAQGNVGPAERSAILQQFFLSTFGLYCWFATITAVNGIVSNDRQKGTFRFLFSKPISVLRYYAQAWVLHGIGVVIVISLLAGLFSAAVQPFFPPRLLIYMSVYYVLLGGIGFLASAITRRDAVAVVLVWLMSLVIHARIAVESGLGWKVLNVLIPPSHKTTPLMIAILTGQPLDIGAVWWALGYGLACFVAGLAVIRFRPMAQ